MTRLLLMGLLLLLPNIASANTHDALKLAQLCVNEAGFGSLQDCDGLYEVLSHIRRGGDTIAQTIQRTSPTIGGLREPRRDRQRWVLGLTWSDEKPAAWPESVPWEQYAPRWQRIREWAVDAIAGNRRRICRERPLTWGGEMDTPRAVRLGLRQIDCGATRNRFYQRGSR